MIYSVVGFLIGIVILARNFIKWNEDNNNLRLLYGIKDLDLSKYAKKVMDESFHEEYSRIMKQYKKGLILWSIYIFLYLLGFVLLVI